MNTAVIRSKTLSASNEMQQFHSTAKNPDSYSALYSQTKKQNVSTE